MAAGILGWNVYFDGLCDPRSNVGFGGSHGHPVLIARGHPVLIARGRASRVISPFAPRVVIDIREFRFPGWMRRRPGTGREAGYVADGGTGAAGGRRRWLLGPHSHAGYKIPPSREVP